MRLSKVGIIGSKLKLSLEKKEQYSKYFIFYECKTIFLSIRREYGEREQK